MKFEASLCRFFRNASGWKVYYKTHFEILQIKKRKKKKENFHFLSVYTGEQGQNLASP